MCNYQNERQLKLFSNLLFVYLYALLLRKKREEIITLLLFLGYENDCLDTVWGKYKTSQKYEYDSLYQLTRAEGYTEYNPAHSQSPEFTSKYTQLFSFDSAGFGNMILKDSAEKTSTIKPIGDDLNYTFDYEYDSEKYAHRLLRAGDRHYKYDANGNIVEEKEGAFDEAGGEKYHKINEEADDVYSTDYGWGLFREKESVKNSERYHRTYTWNEKNQLVSTSDAQYTVNYVYGQDGQRAAKYTAQSETLYFNKMWTLHTDGGNSHLGGEYAKNVYLGETRIVTKLVSANEIRAWEEVNKIYFYHSDHLGSASLITDENGNEYQRLEYTPYGEVWVDKYSQIQESTALLPYKFTGKERDEETGLYYYGARYLDPKYSHWMSTDPALSYYVEGKSNGSSGGIYNSINLNLYHYAGNNPINYTDPTGMELEEGASVSEQLSYLEKIVFASYDTPQAKADAAKNLRTEMRGNGAKNFNLDELFYGKDGDEKFMNENLREFLNTSDTGNAYTLSDMNGKGWRKMGRLGSSEHQHNTNGGRNVKYVNDLDGKEAIFDARDNFISDGLDVGTYNYGSTGGISRLFGWVSWSSHGKYDMMPFFRQNNINPIYWPFTNIDSCNYGINSVNRYWKGRLDTGRRDV